MISASAAHRTTNVGVTENIHEAHRDPAASISSPAAQGLRSSRHGVIGIIVHSNGWVPQQAPQSSRGRLLYRREKRPDIKRGERKIKRADHVPGSCDLLDGFLAHLKKKRWRSRDNENQVGE